MFKTSVALLTVVSFNLTAHAEQKSNYESLLPKKSELSKEGKLTEISPLLKKENAHQVNTGVYNTRHHCRLSPDIDYYTGLLPDIRKHNTHASSCVHGY